MTFEQAIEVAARALAGVEDNFGEPVLMHVVRYIERFATAEGRAGELARPRTWHAR